MTLFKEIKTHREELEKREMEDFDPFVIGKGEPDGFYLFV